MKACWKLLSTVFCPHASSRWRCAMPLGSVCRCTRFERVRKPVSLKWRMNKTINEFLFSHFYVIQNEASPYTCFTHWRMCRCSWQRQPSAFSLPFRQPMPENELLWLKLVTNLFTIYLFIYLNSINPTKHSVTTTVFACAYNFFLLCCMAYFAARFHQVDRSWFRVFIGVLVMVNVAIVVASSVIATTPSDDDTQSHMYA